MKQLLLVKALTGLSSTRATLELITCRSLVSLLWQNLEQTLKAHAEVQYVCACTQEI